MDLILEKVKTLWDLQNIPILPTSTDEEIAYFHLHYDLLIPKDMIQYFKLLNGTKDNYDDKMLNFYSLSNFKSIDEELKNWDGIPDYSNIINTFKEHKSCFVFADYFMHIHTYAICLNKIESAENKIYVISGDLFKCIANSFSEFLTLYLNESIDLQL